MKNSEREAEWGKKTEKQEIFHKVLKTVYVLAKGEKSETAKGRNLQDKKDGGFGIRKRKAATENGGGKKGNREPSSVMPPQKGRRLNPKKRGG